jgi:hypothetical protein
LFKNANTKSVVNIIHVERLMQRSKAPQSEKKHSPGVLSYDQSLSYLHKTCDKHGTSCAAELLPHRKGRDVLEAVRLNPKQPTRGSALGDVVIYL